jgi:hypothetical protein
MKIDILEFEEVIFTTQGDECQYFVDEIETLEMDGTDWKLKLKDGGFIFFPHASLQKIEFTPKMSDEDE